MCVSCVLSFISPRTRFVQREPRLGVPVRTGLEARLTPLRVSLTPKRQKLKLEKSCGNCCRRTRVRLHGDGQQERHRGELRAAFNPGLNAFRVAHSSSDNQNASSERLMRRSDSVPFSTASVASYGYARRVPKGANNLGLPSNRLPPPDTCPQRRVANYFTIGGKKSSSRLGSGRRTWQFGRRYEVASRP